MKKKISLAGKSESTYTNYSRYIAMLSLHFKCLPHEISPEQVNDYLYKVQVEHDTPSDSYFKHTVYGLRFVYRMFGMKDNRIELPEIRKVKKLPVVLSRQEMIRLLKAPQLLKHRMLLGVLYGCGLRCEEVRNLKISDLDFDRMTLHVRQGKGKKDRYVPLCEMLTRGLKNYIAVDKPQTWLFNGYLESDSHLNTARLDGRIPQGEIACRFSQRGIQWAVAKAKKDAGITKEMSTHTLRHTYATHLLEDGLDIVTIKDLLGHSNIETTMVYLHVAQSGRVKPFSPLDTLYPNQTKKK